MKINNFLIKLTKIMGRDGYFYRPERPMIWHKMYDYKWMTIESRRLARESMLPSEWTEEVWDESLRFWGNRCAACGGSGLLQRDHLIPVAHRDCPGAVPSNLIPLCKGCNKDKSYHDFAAWYRRVFGKDPSKIITKIHDWQWHCINKGWH